MLDWRNYGRVVGLAAVLCLAGAAAGVPTAGAESGADIVLLVDLSTSMRHTFPEVRERLNHEIDLAHPGDRVVVVTFGEGAHLLARRRVRGPADRAYLRALVQSLEPVQRATYLTKGLDRGFRELEALFAQAPDRERRLLWLSDDKNNPPDFLGEDVLTLTDLRALHDDSEPRGEWFAFDAPLVERLGTEVGGFLQWARRSEFALRVREPLVALGDLTGPSLTTTTTLHFSPQHGALAGLEFLIVGRVTEADNLALPPRDVRIEPSTVVVQEQDWAQTFTLTFEGPPGPYAGYLIFESFARENFHVEPDRIPLAFTLEAPLLLAEDEPELLGEPDLVAEEAPVGDVPVGRLGRPGRAVEFSDVRPGRRYKETLLLRPTAPLAADALQVEYDMPLPEGVALTHAVREDGAQVRLDLVLELAEDLKVDFALQTGSALSGYVRFHADDPRVQVLPAQRQVLVQFRTAGRPGPPGRPVPSPEPESGPPVFAPPAPLVRLGAPREPAPAPPGLIPPAPVPPSPARRIPLRQSPYVFLLLAGCGVVAALVLVAVLVRRRPKPTDVFGELLVVKDPGRRKIRDLNLHRIAAVRGRLALVVGSGARSDIRLRHDSVSDLHARLLTEADNGEVHMALHPSRGSEVRVNDRVVTEPHRLRDKDLLGLGDFLFLFSAPQPKRRVVVHFIDSSVLHGTPLNWNISESSFELLVERSGRPDDVAHVDFHDLKAVFFLADDRAPGWLPTGPGVRRTSELLDVEFPDGETLAGYAMSDYSDVTPRFYLVPADAEELTAVLIERANVRQVRRHKATNGTVLASAERKWSRLLPWS